MSVSLFNSKNAKTNQKQCAHLWIPKNAEKSLLRIAMTSRWCARQNANYKHLNVEVRDTIVGNLPLYYKYPTCSVPIAVNGFSMRNTFELPVMLKSMLPMPISSIFHHCSVDSHGQHTG